MTALPLHAAVESGDVQRVRDVLAITDDVRAALGACDEDDATPLMRAIAMSSLPIVLALLKAGASPHAIAYEHRPLPRSVLAHALSAGDPAIVAALLDAGADLHYSRDGYSALIDAVHGRDVHRDLRLCDLLRLLIERGARLNDVTSHHESGLRVLSRLGRFDGVALLLDAGADEAQLEWTPLHRAVALDTIDDVRREIEGGADIEARDTWSRTPWHVALLIADVAKAELLRRRGADPRATGRCGKTSLFFAIHSRSSACIRYMLALRPPIEETDQFGGTALMEAAEIGDVPAVALLLDAGAFVDVEKVRAHDDAEAVTTTLIDGGWPALARTCDPAVARSLLDAGADPQHLTYEARRALVGLPAEPSSRLLDSTPAQYRAGRERRFGIANPERIDEPHWLAMIRAGVGAYSADKRFDGGSRHRRPTPGWCAQRYGQSLTFLPDGRIVQVGGEHEDWYDPDFCIYNDVFVHAPDGTIAIYGYPEAVFPPTDFHTATLIGDMLWLIGCLGYEHAPRASGTTPVFALDVHTFRIEPIATHGRMPGWIHRHRAVRRGADEIVVSGGVRMIEDGDLLPSTGTFVLNVRTRLWE